MSRRHLLPLTFALLTTTLALPQLACTGKNGGGQGQGAVGTSEVDEGDGSLVWRDDADISDAIPVSLTASDGTGLRLTDYRARAVIEGPLAFTELDLVFENPEARVREGRFEINLPPGAAISRFAMKIDGRWQEAEVVERQAARRAYEDFLHRRQDPALLEKKAGNQFRARVFPIPANGVKEIKVSYSQELRASNEPYRVHLQGLPRLDHLDVDVAIARGSGSMSSSMGGASNTVEHLHLKEDAVAPRADLEVRFAEPIAEQGVRAGEFAVARVKPPLALGPAAIPGLTVMVDTSASRALGWRGQVDRLAGLIDQLAAESDFPLQVVAFDQTQALIFEGKASDFSAQGKAKLAARAPLGASDLDGALRRLPQLAKPHARVLVLSDGIATAGELDHSRMREAVSALGKKGVERIDAVVEGGIQDEATLAALTRGALPKSGIVASGRLTRDTLVRKLRSEAASKVKVEVPGAAWVWPATLDGVQAGDEVLVYAALDPAKPFAVRMSSEEPGVESNAGDLVVPMRASEGKLLERAWSMANIERLQAQLQGIPKEQSETRTKLRDQIIEISTSRRVLSDYTALLVLETEDDYARFGIDRKALADILTVGPSGLELLDRAKAQADADPEPVPDPDTVMIPKSDLSDEKQGGLEAKKSEAPDDDLAKDRADGMRHAGEEGRMGRANFAPAADILEGQMEAPGEARMNAAAPGDEADGDVWGGLSGTEVGEAYGVGGLGLVGTGRGGGGVGAEPEAEEAPAARRRPSESGVGYGRGSGAAFGGRGRRVPAVRQGQATVQGALDRDVIRRIVRAHINEVRACYNQGLSRDPNLGGRMDVDFVINATGSVTSAEFDAGTLGDAQVGMCVAQAVKRWRFPSPPGGGVVRVRYPFTFSSAGGSADGAEVAELFGPVETPKAQDAWTGRFATVMQSLQSGATALARDDAQAWREAEPGSQLALLAMGEAAEATGDWEHAARAYGSIIDLFPSRADLRRMAGERLERIGPHSPAALELAIDTYRQAVEQRPDHPASHRLLAYALVKAGRHAEAFDAIEKGVKQSYPGGRFAGVDQILREDLSLIASAWRRAEPKAESAIQKRLEANGASFDTQASTRFVLNWETDANDVDFHIYDARGGHAYYSQKHLRSGGKLYADVTTGYGPECFTIPGKASAGPYTLQAHYYSMGPMGYGMGKLQVITHDGNGGLSFEENPFVIMKDSAYVDLGVHDPKSVTSAGPIVKDKDPTPNTPPTQPLQPDNGTPVIGRF